MKRTQIYLTPSEAEGVSRVAASTDRKQSEVIREAIDQYLQRFGPKDKLARLRAASGIWKDRDDMDLQTLRQEFDRF
jgi:Arc/MetJ-type ribon-helix-helix transcriptional regulator